MEVAIRQQYEIREKKAKEAGEEIQKKEKKAKDKTQELTAKIIGKETVKAHTLEELSQPKDKWKVGHTLLDLEKKFPMDEIVRKMVKEEFKANRIFRYPEEYEVYDEEEEVKRKLKIIKKTAKKEDPNVLLDHAEAMKKKRRQQIEELKRKPDEEIDKEKQKRREEAADMKKLRNALKDSVQGYLKSKEKRINEKAGTLRNFIGETYKNLSNRYSDEINRRFPFIDYGLNEEAKKEQNNPQGKRKLYPKEFKAFFLEVIRGYATVAKGKYVQAPKKNVPFWLPSSKPCPQKDKGVTLGDFSKKTANIKARPKSKTPKERELNEFYLACLE